MLLFADPRSATSALLTRAALRTAAAAGVEVVAVVDAAGAPPRGPRRARALLGGVARRVFEPGAGHRPSFSSSSSAARRHHVPVLVPPGRAVNDPAFVDGVRRDLRPDASLAIMVSQIFAPPLLEACAQPANYHNGLLPLYRGIAATSWSVYHGEPRSGFSFHYMDERVDAGPLLLQDAVAVPPGAPGPAVERAKTLLAASRMPEVLELLAQGGPGTPQRGKSSSFRWSDLRDVRDIPDPSALAWDELERRFRAFQLLFLRIADQRWGVTTLRRIEGTPSRPALAFTTADGVHVEPTRFVHLPLALYRVYRWLEPGAA